MRATLATLLVLVFATPSIAAAQDKPVPRGADGKPDLSGVWDLRKDKPCPRDGCPDMQLSEQFFDIGFGLQGGLPYQPWAAALVKERMAKDGREDPTSSCLPGGIVKMHTSPYYNKIVQRPGLFVILHEREVTYREVFMDGRPLPADPLPSWKGVSVGRWDGDTLVVQSAGFREGIWLDRIGSPLTDAARITERFRRTAYGRLEVAITVDDPRAYTRPWTVTVVQLLVADTDLSEFVCLENEKDSARLLK